MRTFLVAFLSLMVASVARADDPPAAPLQVIVQLQPGASIQALNAAYGSTLIDSISVRSIHLLRVPPLLTASEFVDIVEDDPNVLRATLNLLGTDVNANGSTQSIFLRTSREEYDRGDAAVQIGADNPTLTQSGRGITVAVLDTGLDVLHPDLAGRIASGSWDFLTNQALTQDPHGGIDSNGNGRFDEFVGHGTHVAGVIARVAPNASILALRVMDSDGQATAFDIADALYFAADQNVQIINISLGFPTDAPFLREAFNEVTSRGILVIAAAGNDGQSSSIRYPAAYTSPLLLSVAALDLDGVRLGFSNVSPEVSISAPGFLIAGLLPDAGFGLASGTSFAAPLVSGTAAAILSSCRGLTALQTRAAIVQTADDIRTQNPNDQDMLGAGRISIDSAITSASCSFRCAADVDNGERNGLPDGSVDGDDTIYFFQAYDQSRSAADFNSDVGVDGDDVIAFFARWDSGC